MTKASFVTFGETDGITALVAYTGLEGLITIPLDSGMMVGVRRDRGAISVILRSGGRDIGFD